jgi:hypothetical protein
MKYQYNKELNLFTFDEDMVLAKHLVAIIKQKAIGDIGYIIRVDLTNQRYVLVELSKEDYSSFCNDFYEFLLRKKQDENYIKAQTKLKEKKDVEEKEKRPLITDMVQDMIDRLDIKIMNKLDSLSYNSGRLG